MNTKVIHCSVSSKLNTNKTVAHAYVTREIPQQLLDSMKNLISATATPGTRTRATLYHRIRNKTAHLYLS